ncbi:HAD family acid phosphatase [Streptomyces sp. SAJ15]|uniref:HAD family acid phosphatase n=1 Tax=Streptomyces sp. SAJ15 TaxID=2011095 RepID=UPI001184FB1E|nr:HAD family acid phosphatase [Streptomyces sp. SAJ15]TVL94074.1 hydrolase [Streptomyces sp. SAJ15]
MSARSWGRRLGVTTAAVAATLGMAATTTPVAQAATGSATPTVARTVTGSAGTATALPTINPSGVDYDTWQRDVKAVIDPAFPYVEQRTENAAGQKQAIVLDIDNTSLETDFHLFLKYPTPAVRQVLQLAQYAHARGVAIFFVTARPDILDLPTRYNLEKVGFPVQGLYVRHLPDLFDEKSEFKTAKRAEIEAKGYTIIANIGNNTSDLVGGHAERTYKLPDYGGKLS